MAGGFTRLEAAPGQNCHRLHWGEGGTHRVTVFLWNKGKNKLSNNIKAVHMLFLMIFSLIMPNHRQLKWVQLN